MPDLAYIPAGTNLFVDTNIFTLHFQNRSISCTAFIDRIARGELTAYVNTEVLSDLLHKMMLYEAVVRGLIGRARVPELRRRLQGDRALIGHMPDHQTQFEQTMAIGLNVLPVSGGLLIKTRRERTLHGLLTNDSVHLGSMVYRKTPLSDIATWDGDFAHIPAITVWEPTDVIAPAALP